MVHAPAAVPVVPSDDLRSRRLRTAHEDVGPVSDGGKSARIGSDRRDDESVCLPDAAPAPGCVRPGNEKNSVAVLRCLPERARAGHMEARDPVSATRGSRLLVQCITESSDGHVIIEGDESDHLRGRWRRRSKRPRWAWWSMHRRRASPPRLPAELERR